MKLAITKPVSRLSKQLRPPAKIRTLHVTLICETQLEHATFDMNRLQECRRDYEIALAIQESEDAHDEVKVAYMLHNMGNLETGCGRYEEAMEYFKKAVDIRRAQGDRAAGQLALTYLCMGRLYYFQRKCMKKR